MRDDLATDLVLEVFRLNGALIASGDELVSELGLTSARWQVLGAIALQPSPAPVVRLAESMGLARQSVQRIADDLANEGIVAYEENPNHRRAKLVTLTRKGQSLYAAATRRQRPWAKALIARVSAKDIETTLKTLRHVRDHLTSEEARP